MSRSTSDIQLYMAPLQGFTDYIYRTAFNRLFGSVNAAFSPFLNSYKIDQRIYRDVLPERNIDYTLIPQLLGNDPIKLLHLTKNLVEMGYSEINLNLGCPYPMVTKHTMGAGLLPFPERIDNLLNELTTHGNCKLSVKMRLGLKENTEWKPLVSVLNRYPLTEVIIHPRTATQMYKGDVELDSFKEFAEELKMPVCYNGNINTLEDFQQLSLRFPAISRWMIGRGVLANPLLFNEIQNNQKTSEREMVEALNHLHDELLLLNISRLNGDSHLLNKMKPYWEYFGVWLEGKEKGLKRIRKATTVDHYKNACNEVLKH